jgi:hypothetical protein
VLACWGAMSSLGPKLNTETQEDRPILTVVPGRDAEAETTEQAKQENPKLAKAKAGAAIILAITLVLVTSHMTGPNPRGNAENLLTSAGSKIK